MLTPNALSVVTARRVRTSQPQSEAKTGGLFSWVPSGVPTKTTPFGVRTNLSSQVKIGSTALPARFTVVLIISTPVAGGTGELFRIATTGLASNGIRIDAGAGTTSTVFAYTANGVVNGAGKTIAYAAVNEAPVVMVSNWTPTGHTSWGGKGCEAVTVWAESMSMIVPSPPNIYIGAGTNPCHPYGVIILPGNVSDAQARAIIRNPYQIFLGPTNPIWGAA
jgi:hypothetical protein